MNSNPQAFEPCPSDLRLDAYCAGESDPSDHETLRLHIKACVRCEREVELRRKGFAAAGGTQQAYLARFRNRIDEHDRVRSAPDAGSSNKNDRKSWFLGWKPAACALVTAGIALIVVARPQPAPKSTQTDHELDSSQYPQIRAKGGPSLEVFASRQGHVEQIADDAKLQEGDKLRFRVSLTNPSHIMLIGQEASGALYPIATAPKQASISMPVGMGQTLDQTIELDDSQGNEALHLVSCGSPFEFERVSFTGKDLNSPRDCNLSSIFFEKVPLETP